jgi:RNA 3'-terminal phosphate cyclase
VALAGGGSFTTVRLSRHATTNIEIIKKFLDVDVTTAQKDNRTWQVDVKS